MVFLKANRTVKNIVFKLLSMVVSFIAAFVITRIVVDRIGSEAYGFYSLSNDFVNYAMIISIALNSMSNRFVTLAYYDNDKERYNGYFNSILIANIILAIVLLGPLLFLSLNMDSIINIQKEYTNDVKCLFAFMFLNFLISIISSTFTAATFIKNRVDLDALRTGESYIIKVIVFFLLFSIIRPRIYYLGVATLISTTYVLVVNYYYVKKLTPEIDVLNRYYFSTSKIREVLQSGAWNCLTRLGAILLSGVDLLLANLFVSTQAMGILSISKTIPKLVISAMANFATTFNPQITIHYAKRNMENCVKSVISAINVCALLSIAIQTVIFSCGIDIYKLWVPTQDSELLYSLSIIAIIGYLVLMPFECLYIIFTITNKIKTSSLYLLCESLITIGLVLIGVNVVNDDFTKLFIIAGVSSIAEIIRGMFFLPLFSSKCLGIKYTTFYRPLIRILFGNLVSIVICLCLKRIIYSQGVVGLIISIVISSLISGIVWFCIILDKDYKRNYISVIRGLRK